MLEKVQPLAPDETQAYIAIRRSNFTLFSCAFLRNIPERRADSSLSP